MNHTVSRRASSVRDRSSPLLSLDRETHARDQEKEEEKEYGAAKTLPTEASAKSKSLSSRDQSRKGRGESPHDFRQKFSICS